MKRFRWLGLLTGLGLFAWILKTQNLSEVWAQVRTLQWRFLLILLFYPVIFSLDTLGWRYALREKERGRVRWSQLLRTRLAGETINYITPTAWVGGEPIKAYLLFKRYGVPMADGMASVVLAKTTFSVSMFFFIVTGVFLTAFTPGVDPLVFKWVWVLLPMLGVFLGLFLAVQFLKPFQQGALALSKVMPAWVRNLSSKVQEWDEALVRLYRQSPKAVFLSFFFHFLGWIAGVLDLLLILYLLGIPVRLGTAWSIECLWLLLKSGAFMIPASLGASEGFSLLVCTWLGLSAVSGLSLALVRRARELIWVGLGLAEFSRG